jgi:hypothetical protein
MACNGTTPSGLGSTGTYLAYLLFDFQGTVQHRGRSDFASISLKRGKEKGSSRDLFRACLLLGLQDDSDGLERSAWLQSTGQT